MRDFCYFVLLLLMILLLGKVFSHEVECNLLTQFVCHKSHGQCIPRIKLCDGIPDCTGAGEDEDDYFCKHDHRCFSQTEWSCHNKNHPCKQCIPRTKVCDGVRDCVTSGSDENFEFCEKKWKCRKPYHEFECLRRPHNGSSPSVRKCIRRNQLCDGVQDCPENDDETHCDKLRCNSLEMKCSKGPQCVLIRNVCNGVKDCRDGEDEQSLFCLSIMEKFCVQGSNNWVCPESHQCILRRQVCNGMPDCRLGEDENEEFCTNSWTCNPATEWQCPIGRQCIPKTSMCNGITDCEKNGEDEGSRCTDCARNQWQCPSDRNCIPEAKLCDSVSDCSFGEDEDEQLGCGGTLSWSVFIIIALVLAACFFAGSYWYHRTFNVPDSPQTNPYTSKSLPTSICLKNRDWFRVTQMTSLMLQPDLELYPSKVGQLEELYGHLHHLPQMTLVYQCVYAILDHQILEKPMKDHLPYRHLIAKRFLTLELQLHGHQERAIVQCWHNTCGHSQITKSLITELQPPTKVQLIRSYIFRWVTFLSAKVDFFTMLKVTLIVMDFTKDVWLLVMWIQRVSKNQSNIEMTDHYILRASLAIIFSAQLIVAVHVFFQRNLILHRHNEPWKNILQDVLLLLLIPFLGPILIVSKFLRARRQVEEASRDLTTEWQNTNKINAGKVLSLLRRCRDCDYLLQDFLHIRLLEGLLESAMQIVLMLVLMGKVTIWYSKMVVKVNLLFPFFLTVATIQVILYESLNTFTNHTLGLVNLLLLMLSYNFHILARYASIFMAIGSKEIFHDPLGMGVFAATLLLHIILLTVFAFFRVPHFKSASFSSRVLHVIINLFVPVPFVGGVSATNRDYLFQSEESKWILGQEMSFSFILQVMSSTILLVKSIVGNETHGGLVFAMINIYEVKNCEMFFLLFVFLIYIAAASLFALVMFLWHRMWLRLFDKAVFGDTHQPDVKENLELQPILRQTSKNDDCNFGTQV